MIEYGRELEHFAYIKTHDGYIEKTIYDEGTSYRLWVDGYTASRAWCGLEETEGRLYGVWDVVTEYFARRKGYATLLMQEIVKDYGEYEIYLICTTPHYELYTNVGFEFIRTGGEMIRQPTI